MKINFTIELPCKDHENCYNLELDEGNQAMNYKIEGQPKLANGVTTINLGNVTTGLSPNNPQKITITEEFTKKVAKLEKNPEPINDLLNKEDFQPYFDNLNKEHNNVVFKHNDVIDENGKLKKNLSEVKEQMRKTHPDPKDSIEYKELLQELNSYKDIQEMKMQKLQDDLDEKKQKTGLDEQIRIQKFKDFERELKEKEEIIKMLKQEKNDNNGKMEKLEKDQKDYEKNLDQKYEHFEEMNKYINELLLEKKNQLARMEEKERQIKEMEYDMNNIIRYTTQVENNQTSTNFPQNSITDNIIKKYTKITTTTTVRKIKRKKKNEDGTEIIIEEDVQDNNENELQENPEDFEEREKQGKINREKQIGGSNNEDFEKLKQEIENLKNENKFLRDQNQTDQSKTQNQLNNLDSNKQGEKNLEQNKYDINQMKKNLDQSYKQIQTLQNQHENLTDEINEQKRLIENLKNQNQQLQNDLQNKKPEIITVTKEINKKETDTIQKKDELKTLETKIIKVKEKEKITEWKTIHDESQNLAKLLKETLEKDKNQPIHDNLDLEITQESGQAYSEVIQNYIGKSSKYAKSLGHVLEDRKNQEEEIKRLKKQLRENSESQTDLQTVKEIFDRNKVSTEYFTDILKLAKKEKFINTKTINVSSEEPNLYLEAINEQFDLHKDYYKNIVETLQEKNDELARLRQLEKDLKSGKNKEAALEDFKNIYSQIDNEKNKYLDINDLLEGKESNNVPTDEVPNTTNELIDEIDKMLYGNQQLSSNIKRSVEDLLEENQNLKEKLKQNSNKGSQVDPNELKQILNTNHQQNKKLQDMITKENLTGSQTFQVKLEESNDHDELIKQIKNKQENQNNQIQILDQILQNKNDDINKLQEYEKQVKSGQKENSSVNDLSYVLKRNKTLLNQTAEIYEENLKKKPEIKEIEVKNETSEEYVNCIKNVIMNNSNLLNEFNQKFKEQEKKISQVEIYEKEFKQAAKQNYDSLHQKSKKNLKNLFDLIQLRKKPNEKADVWKSTVFNEETKDQEVLDAISKNFNQEQNYIRQLEDLLQQTENENKNLAQFKNEVLNGQNKHGNLEDFKKNYYQAEEINQKTKECLEKASGKQVPSTITRVNEKDPENLLQVTEKLNNESSKLLLDLKEELQNKNEKLSKLEKFEQDVNSGKNKIGAKDDLKNILDDQKKRMNQFNQIMKDLGEGDLPENFKFQENPKTPEEILEDIQNANKFLEDYIKRLKQRIENIHNELQNQVRKNKELSDKIEELEKEKGKQKLTEMEIIQTMEAQKSSSVSFDQLQSLLDQEIKQQTQLNYIIATASKTDQERTKTYNIESKESQKLVTELDSCIKLNSNKMETIMQLIKKDSSTDTLALINILKKLEELKEHGLTSAKNFSDEGIQDDSGVNIKKAIDEQSTVEQIYKDLQFLNEFIDNYQDLAMGKINTLIQAKNQILQERDKFKLMVEDLQNEVDKKTTLIGKLQVKIYMLLSILEFREQVESTASQLYQKFNTSKRLFKSFYFSLFYSCYLAYSKTLLF